MVQKYIFSAMISCGNCKWIFTEKFIENESVYEVDYRDGFTRVEALRIAEGNYRKKVKINCPCCGSVRGEILFRENLKLKKLQQREEEERQKQIDYEWEHLPWWRKLMYGGSKCEYADSRRVRQWN